MPEMVAAKTVGIGEDQKALWEQQKQDNLANKPVAPVSEMSPVQKREAKEAENKSLAAQTQGMQQTRTYTAIGADGKPHEVKETGAMASWSDGMRDTIKKAGVEGDDRWALGEVSNPAQYFDPNTGAFDSKRMNADLLEQKSKELALKRSTPEGMAELQNEYYKSPEGRMALGDYNTAQNAFKSKHGGINQGGQQAQEEAGKRLAAGLNGYLATRFAVIDEVAKGKKDASEIEVKLQDAWQRGDEAAKKLYSDQLNGWDARNAQLVSDMSKAYTAQNSDENAANRTNAASANDRGLKGWEKGVDQTLGAWQQTRADQREEWRNAEETKRFNAGQGTLQQGQSVTREVGLANAKAAEARGDSNANSPEILDHKAGLAAVEEGRKAAAAAFKPYTQEDAQRDYNVGKGLRTGAAAGGPPKEIIKNGFRWQLAGDGSGYKKVGKAL